MIRPSKLNYVGIVVCDLKRSLVWSVSPVTFYRTSF